MHHLEKSLEAFFSGEAKVAVIKGEWGVGKTFFWENYISRRIEARDLKQIAYSYISLFGNSSLSDIRGRVFRNAKAIGTNEEVDSVFSKEFDASSSLFNRVPWVKEGLDKGHRKSPFLNWLTRHSDNLPIVNKYSGMISSLEYGLVKNYIVCIDDIERKGKGLSVKEVMGLVDELAQRKACKVVLIFNESSLDSDEDVTQFKSYREKVVDIEINHNPTCRENLSRIFTREFERYKALEEVIVALEIKNIRVIRKLKWINEQFGRFLEGQDSRIVDEFIVHATLLSWAYYIRDEDLSYDLIKEKLSKDSWLSYFADKDKELSLSEQKFRTISTSLNISRSVFDEHITHYLENGYFDEEALKDTVNKFQERVLVDSVKYKLQSAWDIYTESFSDNLHEFKTALLNILNDDLHMLGLSDFSSAIDVLEEFDEDVSAFVTKYIEIHSEALSKAGRGYTRDLDRIKCKLLREEIENLRHAKMNFNLDDMAMKLATQNGWNPEDIEYLSTLSKADYLEWMKSDPDDLVTKIRGGLLSFRNVQSHGGDQELYDTINANVIGALKDIANENDLNRYRVNLIYGID